MKLRLPCLIVFFLSPLIVFGYNAYDYDPDYRPYNFDQALEFNECDNSIESFDQVYTQLTAEYVYQQDNPEGLFGGALEDRLSGILNNLESNKFSYQVEFNKCIETGTSNEEEEAKERARERFEEEQLAKLQKAIDECDLEYLENLSVSDKMATYDERTACKEKPKETEQTPETQIPTPISVPVQTTYTPPPQPVSYTPPPKPIAVQTPDTNVTEEETDISTTTEATSTPKEIVVTEEELDRMVQEKLDEALASQEAEPEPEPEKPSVFKRVINFLFGWL